MMDMRTCSWRVAAGGIAAALSVFCISALALAQAQAQAQAQAPAAPPAPAPAPAPNAALTANSSGKVVVSGTVPDEATRAAILGKVREVYGAERVVDQLGVGNLVAPPNWSALVQKLITPELKKVNQGQLKINGNVVDLVGSVKDEAVRQQVPQTMTTALNNPTYTVRNNLRVGAGQELLDAALANRIIEFQPGNAELTAAGVQVLNDLLPVLQQFSGRRFEILGHTDDQGPRPSNLALSLARANAVRAYLVSRGIARGQIETGGWGPDKPVAENSTQAGRARNRRIEFRVLA
jgi:OmpA-OmpF porin, OOP family